MNIAAKDLARDNHPRNPDEICGRFDLIPSFCGTQVYRIDEAAMTVRQMGQFILTKSESSCYISKTHQLPVTGNIFIQPGGTGSNTAIAREVTTKVADDGSIAFDKVVFDATVDMSVVDTNHWYVYSYRGHRWTF